MLPFAAQSRGLPTITGHRIASQPPSSGVNVEKNMKTNLGSSPRSGVKSEGILKRLLNLPAHLRDDVGQADALLTPPEDLPRLAARDGTLRLLVRQVLDLIHEDLHGHLLAAHPLLALKEGEHIRELSSLAQLVLPLAPEERRRLCYEGRRVRRLALDS